MSESDLQVTALRAMGALRGLGIPFHVTGGLASSFYGEPRLTQDIDLVVRLEERSVPALCRALEPDFLVERKAVMEAIRRRSMFQTLDRRTYLKVDFHVGERIEGELDRSSLEPLFEGQRVPIVSKEDAIVSKLLWIKEGSEKSRRDVLGMLLDPRLFDIARTREMARALGCGQILEEIEREVERRLGGG